MAAARPNETRQGDLQSLGRILERLVRLRQQGTDAARGRVRLRRVGAHARRRTIDCPTIYGSAASSASASKPSTSTRPRAESALSTATSTPRARA